MILKVRGEGCSWWVYGELKKVRYTPKKIKVETKSKLVEEFDKYDLLLLNGFCSCAFQKDAGCNRCPQLGEWIKYTEICFRDKENDEFTIAFNTIAYLCNDEGRTVEKIIGK